MRLRAITLTIGLLAGLWLACGDDYQESGPLTGDVGAKCFPDGSCKAGLLCLSSLCVAPPDSGVGTSSSGSSEAGATDDAGGTDSGDDGTAGCGDVDQSGIAPGVVCDGNTKCEPNTLCCNKPAGRWECGSETECGSSGQFFECDSPVDCTGGEQCCFVVTALAQPCSFGTVARGLCAPSCAPKTFTVCDLTHPCAAGTCRDRTLLLQNGSRLMRRGLCEMNP